MTTLHLLRHAKSSWEDRSLRDHARPLAPRGVAAAEAMRRHMSAAAFTVDLVLCSTSERTRRTWDGVQAGVGGEPEVRFTDDIYEADPDDLLALLREVGDDVGDVLLIGHNPGLADLAMGLAGQGDGRATERLHDKYPTCALADLSFDGPWSGLGYGRARLDSFIRPRDLPPV